MNSPKFVLSKSVLLDQYNELKKYADIISYSAKTNYEVAEILEKETDCFLSIHSLEGLEKVKNPKRVWYFAQAWDNEELNKIFTLGISHVVVDNETDLDVVLKYIKEHSLKVSLLLRMKLQEHTIHTGKYFVYGMYSHQVNKLLPELRANPNIQDLGIHFHRKSQNISEWSLQYELSNILSKEALQAITVVNMGGGLPVRYKNFRADVLELVFKEITKLKSWLSENNIQLIIEPGRYISAPCIKLVTTIRNVYDHNVIVNCSVYNSAIDSFVAHNKLEIENELPEHQGEAYTVKGHTPCSMDIFRYRVFLKDPKAGDTLIFINAGAYNFSSDFCNLKKIPTEVVE